MNACIYARTSRIEKRHTTTKIEHQVAFCEELARQHNLMVAPEHVFTDVELTGNLPPTCWAYDDQEGRPALAAMVNAIENGEVSHVIVRRMEKLGTASDVLLGLLELFTQHGVQVVASRDVIEDDSDPSAVFALSVLKPCLLCDSVEQQEQLERERARKREEIARLRAKLTRLESELAGM